ncbi:MAG: hypothetical protein FWG81_06510, partial [Betaproteobacteria bacterium]|nr:hypothetical protein [Betaproteobacteria bacterium]
MPSKKSFVIKDLPLQHTELNGIISSGKSKLLHFNTSGFFAACCAFLSAPVWAQTYVSTESELRDEVAGTEPTITLTDNITLTGSPLTVGSSRDVTLTSDNPAAPWKLIGADGQDAIENEDTLELDGIIVTHTAGQNGSGVYSTGTLNISGNGEISGNTATEGGGVYSTGTLNISGNGEISGNTATEGGGVWSWVGTINVSGNGEISGNTATEGGGVWNWVGTINVSGNGKISGNTASGDGGGVLSADTLNISGNGEISGNIAGGHGGGIYKDSVPFNISENGKISGNTAGGHGGGIYITRSDAFITGGTISNNRADGLGGGIYTEHHTLSLIADTGNITFSGNMDNCGTSCKPNAIYSTGQVFALGATGGHSIYFYDPIANDSSLAIFTININATSGQNGVVLFDKHHSAVYGTTTVGYGIMALTNGATYGAANTVGSFALNAGATLFADAARNTIQADYIALATGSAFAFDLTGAVAVGQTGATTNLVLDGTEVIGSPSAVDIHAFNGAGTFNLAERSDGAFESAVIIPTLRGESIAGTRADGSIVRTDPLNDKVLQLESTAENGIVRWTGNAADGLWNITSGNWERVSDNLPIGTTQFLHGDAVIFDDWFGETVTVAAGGVEIAPQPIGGSGSNIIYNPGMIVSGDGNWAFYGDGITGTGGITHEGSGMLQLRGENTYTGTTRVSGGVLSIGSEGVGNWNISDHLILENGATLYAAFLDADAMISNPLATLDVYGSARWEGGALNMEGQTMRFFVPTTMTDKESMLTLDGGADAYIGGATVMVGINGASSPLKTGDEIYLIRGNAPDSNVYGTPANTTHNGTGMQGVTLRYAFDIFVDAAQEALVARLASIP